jgi:hypothetical protein
MQEPTDAWPEAIALPTKSQRGPPPLSARGRIREFLVIDGKLTV